MLCFGSLLKILMTSVKAGVQQQDVCSELIMVVGGDNIAGNHTKITRLLTCEANVPDDAIDGAKNIDFETVVTKINAVLLPQYIATDRLTIIVLALKNILQIDAMGESTKLGKYTKAELLDMMQVNVAEFLACILIYVCAEVSNRTYKDGKIDFITEDYVASFGSNKDTITIITKPVIRTQTLSTLDRGDFDTIFHESDGTSKLQNPNYNQVRLFYLDIENNAFSYECLDEFLIDNIGYYVLSRTEMQRLKDRKKDQAACLRAVNAMNQHGTPGQKGTGNDLGEVMVYAFLEDVLGAPKILTKAELTSGSRTDGVHLLKINDAGKDKYQLVLAASDIMGDIKRAVDSVLLRLDNITKAAKSERQMVDRAILSSSFDKDTTEYLKSIIIPSDAMHKRPDISYGIFIGYTLDIDSMLYDNDTYRALATAKMKRDVEEIAPYITSELTKMVQAGKRDIWNHSFYFYFMPFDNADLDKTSIMKNLLSGGMGYGAI